MPISLPNSEIFKYSNILEIGPGAGRWSEILLNRAKHLTVADISEKCLNICKDRFDSTKIDFKLITNFLDFMENNSVDFIWSYDVFVHINPIDIEKYLIDFKRILKPNGYAVIHHSGTFSDYVKSKAG